MPTIAPSAYSSTSATCVGGRDADARRTRARRAGVARAGRRACARLASTSVRAPGDAHRRDGVDEARGSRRRPGARRSSVDVGAARNTRSRPVRSLRAIHSAAASGVMSGVMSPAPPAASEVVGEAVDAVLQHRVPVGHDEHRAHRRGSVIARTAVERVAQPEAGREGGCVASWMTGPSITGSEYGRPELEDVDAVLDERDRGVDARRRGRGSRPAGSR